MKRVLLTNLLPTQRNRGLLASSVFAVFVVFTAFALPPAEAYAQSDAPSLSAAAASPLQARRTGKVPELPTDAGQIYEEYNLRPYTKELSSIDRPHQAVVDWVLRETGTDAWFTDPFGFVSADRDTLRVYHNEEMHQAVRGIYERFVNGTTAPQRYGLRIMAVGSPNWRTRAQALMRTVPAQSPGVQAFLVSKENAALLLASLRGRVDYQEISAVDVVVHNGQAQELKQLRVRNFVQGYEQVAGTWPPYIPSTGKIEEGYQMRLSPLLSVDKSTVDLVVKCDIDQVERLTSVKLDLPLPTGQMFAGQIDVPQVASWRLHERFRWPADSVLLLSCGVVAAPQGTPNNSLLGQGSSLFGLNQVFSPGGDRADALLMIEYRGDAATAAPTGPNTQIAQPPSSPLSRGRY